MQNTENWDPAANKIGTTKKKWIWIVVGIVTIVMVLVVVALSVSRNNTLNFQGTELRLGQIVSTNKLEKSGFVVEPKAYHFILNPDPDPDELQAVSESGNVEIFLEPRNGKQKIVGWSVKEGDEAVSWNGLKIGDSAQRVNEVFPVAEFDATTTKPNFFFYMTESGKVISSREMWEIWENAQNRGDKAVSEVENTYLLVQIFGSVNVQSFSVEYMKGK